MPRWKLPLTVFLLLPTGFSQNGVSVASLSLGIHLVVPCGSIGAGKQRINAKVHFRFAGEGCIAQTPTVDQHDVRSAELLQDVDHPPAIGLTLYPSAAQRMLSVPNRISAVIWPWW